MQLANSSALSSGTPAEKVHSAGVAMWSDLGAALVTVAVHGLTSGLPSTLQ